MPGFWGHASAANATALCARPVARNKNVQGHVEAKHQLRDGLTLPNTTVLPL
jgi:hypothetical protein